MILQLFKRDLKLLFCNKYIWLHPILFFLLVAILIPLGITPNEAILQQIGPSIIWLGFIVANFLVVDNLLQKDFDCGILEQYVLVPRFKFAVWLVKCLAYWLGTALPMLLCLPIVAILYHLTPILPKLLLALLISTPTLSLFIGLSVSFTVSLKNGILLFTILLFPMIAPVTIIATSLIKMSASGIAYHPQWYWLLAYLVLALSIVPFCMDYIIKQSVAS